MKRYIIDTDTASDDALALILALREPNVKIEAITTVMGNVPIETATRNARIAVESELNTGTTISLYFPIYQEPEDSVK